MKCVSFIEIFLPPICVNERQNIKNIAQKISIFTFSKKLKICSKLILKLIVCAAFRHIKILKFCRLQFTSSYFFSLFRGRAQPLIQNMLQLRKNMTYRPIVRSNITFVGFFFLREQKYSKIHKISGFP